MMSDRIIRFLGNNEITVLVSGEEAGGGYCVMELVVQPGGGATALHTDRWVETFHVLEGEVEWTVERDGRLVTWSARPGETVVVPSGVKHRFAGAGVTPSRMLTVGPAEFERFFRALADAWSGPYDRERTPAAVGPVFEAFGMRLVTA
ncbi:MAG TPA: cupin domain-containing protein [Gemmatimonadaceae bacterium]